MQMYPLFVQNVLFVLAPELMVKNHTQSKKKKCLKNGASL